MLTIFEGVMTSGIWLLPWPLTLKRMCVRFAVVSLQQWLTALVTMMMQLGGSHAPDCGSVDAKPVGAAESSNLDGLGKQEDLLDDRNSLESTLTCQNQIEVQLSDQQEEGAGRGDFAPFGDDSSVRGLKAVMPPSIPVRQQRMTCRVRFHA